MKFLLKNGLLTILSSLVFVLSAHASEFDGQWRADAITESGKCKNKYTFSLNISGGFISGSVRGKKKALQLEGSVNDDGSFNIDVSGMERRGFNGVLNSASGSGTWRSGRCSGTLMLKK